MVTLHTATWSPELLRSSRAGPTAASTAALEIDPVLRSDPREGRGHHDPLPSRRKGGGSPFGLKEYPGNLGFRDEKAYPGSQVDYQKNGLTRRPEFRKMLYFSGAKYSRTGLLG